MKKRTLQTFVFSLLLTSGVFAQVGTTSFDQNSADRPGSRNTFMGYRSGNTTLTGFDITAIGYNTGTSITSGYSNVLLGANSGYKTTSGRNNTFLGSRTGYNNTTGVHNTYIGSGTGYNNQTGSYNIFLGTTAGGIGKSGSYNIAIGPNSGFRNAGNNNLFLGRNSGFNNESGSSNVFIGYQAGSDELGSDKLYIENSNSTTPLIYGDFKEDKLVFNGKVSTGFENNSFPTTTSGGTDISDYTLFVKGGLLSEELRVLTGWADYVFYDSYELKSLNELENFIDENGHLPNIPSAAEVESSGIEMGEITKLQQEKIEELTLYTIQQQKEIDELKQLMSEFLASQKQ